MTNHPIIRTIYLYLFALIGLAMATVGAAQIVDLGLKTVVFTQADNNYSSYAVPMPPAYPAPAVSKDFQNAANIAGCADKCQLTADEKTQIQSWLTDYQTWKNDQASVAKIDYKTQNEQREAATALSLIFVGLPLWLYHWTTIKKDQKTNKQA